MIPVFLDTETTGSEAEDRLIQLAYKKDGEVSSGLFKPPLPIKIGAMAVHHITEKMVADKTPFKESGLWHDLKSALYPEGNPVVAHNAKFDVDMLEKEGITVPRYICTMKVAKHLDERAVFDSYSLQFLRYATGIDIEANAHDAVGDILVLEALFEKLAAKLSMKEMIEISSKPSLIKRFPFGKHKGMFLSEVPKDYLQWMLDQKQKEEAPDEDWIYSLTHYLD